MNTNNIFITLRTTPTFTFPNPTVMQNFLSSSFVSTFKPTTYCAQRKSPNLNLFDCLLIYPSGIPNNRFNVIFSFNYTGLSANTTVVIDPVFSQPSSRFS